MQIREAEFQSGCRGDQGSFQTPRVLHNMTASCICDATGASRTARSTVTGTTLKPNTASREWTCNGQVLHLGWVNDSQREGWCWVVEAFNEATQRHTQLTLFPIHREVPNTPRIMTFRYGSMRWSDIGRGKRVPVGSPVTRTNRWAGSLLASRPASQSRRHHLASHPTDAVGVPLARSRQRVAPAPAVV